jgi:hypothetical protein
MTAARSPAEDVRKADDPQALGQAADRKLFIFPLDISMPQNAVSETTVNS